jgi:cell shape-determining protein MreC
MRVRAYVIAGVAGGLALLGSTAVAPLPWLRAQLAAGLQPLAAAVAPAGSTGAEDVIGALHEQIAKLSADNTEMRARLEGYAQIQGEGKVPAERVVVARGRVIGRTRRSGRRYLELDIGRVDGVAKGMPVAMGWSLVGQVAGTDDGRCLVQEVTDSESRVAAMVLESNSPNGAAKSPPTRLCEGVAAGLGRREELLLNFIEAAPEMQLRPGLAVVTAGADGRFPAGMVLGTIREASHAGTDAWQVSIVQTRDPELAESLLVLRFDR